MKALFNLFCALWICLTACSTAQHASPRTWNGIITGTSRSDNRKQLGLPIRTQDFTDIWRCEGWELEVSYDEQGRATNVVRSFTLPR